MKILFLSMTKLFNLNEQGIYSDLLNKLVQKGNEVYIVSPIEKQYGGQTKIYTIDDVNFLNIKIGDISNVSFIKKGINTILLEDRFKRAIKKYYRNITFDMVLFATPPITLYKCIKYIKKRDNAIVYLMLKDIFPQNAIDLGILKENIIYKRFRQKEIKLYKLCDSIGCMSSANVDYLIKKNIYLDNNIIHLSPNSINPSPNCDCNRELVLSKYNIPSNKIIFMYGGNLGKPQSIPFIIECLKKVNNQKCHFVISGKGTDYPLLDQYVKEYNPSNFTLINGLETKEYENLLSACDVGMIFLDHRFSIPNFPSRILSYMDKKKPILACTDTATDVGNVIVDNNFGWWIESNDPSKFKDIIDIICDSDITTFGENAYKYLLDNYTVDKQSDIIFNNIKEITYKRANKEI